jgi:hypothetical protein
MLLCDLNQMRFIGTSLELHLFLPYLVEAICKPLVARLVFTQILGQLESHLSHSTDCPERTDYGGLTHLRISRRILVDTLMSS